LKSPPNRESADHAALKRAMAISDADRLASAIWKDPGTSSTQMQLIVGKNASYGRVNSPDNLCHPSIVESVVGITRKVIVSVS